MSGMGKGYFVFMVTQPSDGQAEEAFRAWHRRPDALPQPPERARPGRRWQVIPALRRRIVGHA